LTKADHLEENVLAALSEASSEGDVRVVGDPLAALEFASMVKETSLSSLVSKVREKTK